MADAGYELTDLNNPVSQRKGVRRAELHTGDVMLVKTRNSLYTIRVLDETAFLVQGGWFDGHNLSPERTTIEGCSWRGHMLKTDLVAACGLCLEFGNRVVTSTVRKVWVFRYGTLN